MAEAFFTLPWLVFLFVCLNWSECFALRARVPFLYTRKEKEPKESAPACLPIMKFIMGSLRCSIEPAGCELAALRHAQPETPAQSVLLGKPERV